MGSVLQHAMRVYTLHSSLLLMMFLQGHVHTVLADTGQNK